MTDPAFLHCGQLASGLSQMPDLRFEQGNWAYRPSSRTMFLATTDATMSDPDRGAVCHETAHVSLTHYLQFRPLPGLVPALGAQFFNAIEDARVNEYTMARSGTCARWLIALHQKHPLPRAFMDSHVMGFLAVAAKGDMLDYALPARSILTETAREALDETAPARQSYARDFLPGGHGAHLESGTVARVFDAEVVPLLTTPIPVLTEENMARMIASARAYRLAEDSILPAFMRLVAADAAALAAKADPDLAEAARQSSRRDALRKLAAEAFASGGAPVDDSDAGDMQAILAAIVDSFTRDAETRRADRSGAAAAGPAVRPATHVRETGGTEGSGPDAGLLASVQRLVPAMADVFENALRGPERRRWQPGFATGRKVDRAALLRREADPSETRVWKRLVPMHDRASAEVLVLVDLSGSMSGDKIFHAAAAVTGLTSALARVEGISWQILGFQDVLIDMARRGACPDPTTLAKALCAEVAGTRRGGNNCPQYNDDGPCLIEAARRLPDHRQRLILVLSDGSPSGRRSNSEDLRKAISNVTASGIHVVGLGLGPGTDHVTKFYPDGQANIPLPDLAETLATALSLRLRAT